MNDANVARSEAVALRRLRASIADLFPVQPRRYWRDLLINAALGWIVLVAGAFTDHRILSVLLFLIATWLLYRAVTFIHELAHLRQRTPQGFRTTWDLLVGVPLLTPSFLYTDTHLLHHQKQRYGRRDDPEYLPLGRADPIHRARFVLQAPLLPVLLFVRFGLLTPLSLFVPPLRRWLASRMSALVINPVPLRRHPCPSERWRWWTTEALCSLWSLCLFLGTAAGVAPGALGYILGVGAVISTLNQVRTLFAHRFESDGRPMGWREQYLDSLDLDGPGWLHALIAPLGTRHHALHHLMPDLPYHALDEARRRLTVGFRGFWERPKGSRFVPPALDGI